MRSSWRFLRKIFSIVVISLLLGCTTPVSYSEVTLTFDHLTPIKLDVASIEIFDTYNPISSRPNVEHLFKYAPNKALHDFSQHRFVAVGKSGRAKFIIENASVVEEILLQSNGPRDILSLDKKVRYVARAVIRLELRSDRGFLQAYCMIRARHQRTIKGQLTLNEIEQIYFEIVEELISEVDREIGEQVSIYFSQYIVS